jgi:hypothetical protein
MLDDSRHEPSLGTRKELAQSLGHNPRGLLAGDGHIRQAGFLWRFLREPVLRAAAPKKDFGKNSKSVRCKLFWSFCEQFRASLYLTRWKTVVK